VRAKQTNKNTNKKEFSFAQDSENFRKNLSQHIFKYEKKLRTKQPSNHAGTVSCFFTNFVASAINLSALSPTLGASRVSHFSACIRKIVSYKLLVFGQSVAITLRSKNCQFSF